MASFKDVAVNLEKMDSKDSKIVVEDVRDETDLPPLQSDRIGSMSIRDDIPREEAKAPDRKADPLFVKRAGAGPYAHMQEGVDKILGFYWPDLDKLEDELSRRRKTTLDIFEGAPKPEGYDKDEDRHYSVLTDDWRAYCRCNCGACCKFATYIIFFPFVVPCITLDEPYYHLHSTMIGFSVLMFYLQLICTLLLIGRDNKENDYGLLAMAFLNNGLLILDTSVAFGDNRMVATIATILKITRRKIVDLPALTDRAVLKSLYQIGEIRPDGNSNIQRRARLAEMNRMKLRIVNVSDKYIKSRSKKLSLLDYDMDSDVAQLLGPHRALGVSYKKQLLETGSVTPAATADQVVYGVHWMKDEFCRRWFRECACDCSMDCIHITYLIPLVTFMIMHVFVAIFIPVIVLSQGGGIPEKFALAFYTLGSITNALHYVKYWYDFVKVFRAEYSRMRTMSSLIVPGMAERYLLPRINLESYDHILAWASIRDYVKQFGLTISYYFGVRFIYYLIYFVLCAAFSIAFFITRLPASILAVLCFNSCITWVVGFSCILLYGMMANGEIQYHRRQFADRMLKHEQHNWIRSAIKSRESKRTSPANTTEEQQSLLRNRKNKNGFVSVWDTTKTWPKFESELIQDNGVETTDRDTVGGVLETVHFYLREVNDTTPVKILCIAADSSLAGLLLTILIPVALALVPIMWWLVSEIYKQHRLNLRIFSAGS